MELMHLAFWVRSGSFQNSIFLMPVAAPERAIRQSDQDPRTQHCPDIQVAQLSPLNQAHRARMYWCLNISQRSA